MKPTKDSKQMLFEMMGKIDPTFKPKQEMLNEWNFDKKKGEDKEKESEEDEKEGDESKEHEESETPEEEKEEHEDKEELDENKPKTKVPVNMIAKVGGK